MRVKEFHAETDRLATSLGRTRSCDCGYPAYGSVHGGGMRLENPTLVSGERNTRFKTHHSFVWMTIRRAKFPTFSLRSRRVVGKIRERRLDIESLEEIKDR